MNLSKPTYILGLHFGHDASIAIIKNGVVEVCVEVERISRIKHHIGIEPKYIQRVLDDAEVSIDDISHCTITSTQAVEIFLHDRKKLDIKFNLNETKYPCTLINKLNINCINFSEKGFGFLKDLANLDGEHPYHQYFPKYRQYGQQKENFIGCFEKYTAVKLWEKVKSLDDIGNTDYRKLLSNDDLSYGFHYPVTVILFGRSIESFVFSHHYSHIAYSYYQSPFNNAALFSHDGGDGNFWSGMFGYGSQNRIYPITPNYSYVGGLYDEVAESLGLDAGKMMGLAPYGKPTFYEPSFIGNEYDLQKKDLTHKKWLNHCLSKARVLGYNLSEFGIKKEVLKPINTDIAASTQKLIEEVILEEVSTLHKLTKFNRLNNENLCYSGGVALNCPANRRIIVESKFKNVFIGPAIHDGGLSIGSAMALYYNIMGNSRDPVPVCSKLAFLGLNSSAKKSNILMALNDYKDKIEYVEEDSKTIALRAARMLSDNLVVGLFNGRSEIGPRALGQRSIFANPTYYQNWSRVNKIKKREFWRPFAPIVLQEEHNLFFENITSNSLFMLINSKVKSKEIPAITHIDGSSRVQSICKDVGLTYEILKNFYRISGIPVLLNTSFNGPKQPVIETAEEALDFYINSELDVLVLDNFIAYKK